MNDTIGLGAWLREGLRAAVLLRDQYGLSDADSGYPSSGTTTTRFWLIAY